MATEYALHLKAQLDTSDVQQKLQQLGTVGTSSFDSLEKAVKSLDSSLKEVVKNIERTNAASAGMNISTGKLLRLGSRYVGGQLLASASDYFAESHNASGQLLAGMAAGGLKGAAAGAMLGPHGSALGAVIGAAVPAFKELANESERTAKALMELSTSAKQAKDVMNREASAVGAAVRMRQRLSEIPGLSDADLAARRLNRQGVIAKYEAYATGEVDFGDADEHQRLNILEVLKEAAYAAEREINAIDKEINERERLAEAKKREEQASQKLAEATSKAAEKTLSQFQTSAAREQFAAGLAGLSPEELQATISMLKTRRSAAATAYESALKNAQTTGSGADLESAQKLGSEFDDITTRLKLAEMALNGLTKVSMQPTLQQATSEAMSSEAAKGYDVGGYAKLEDALWKQQIQISQKTEHNTERVAVAVERQTTAVEEIKNKLQNGSLASTWG